VADIFYLFTCIFIQPLKVAYEYTNWLSEAAQRTFVYVQPYTLALASTAQTITTYTVILVTLDRYIAVCKPLKTKWRSLVRAKLSFLIVVLLSAIYNVPLFMEMETVVDRNSAGEGTRCMAYAAPLPQPPPPPQVRRNRNVTAFKLVLACHLINLTSLIGSIYTESV